MLRWIEHQRRNSAERLLLEAKGANADTPPAHISPTNNFAPLAHERQTSTHFRHNHSFTAGRIALIYARGVAQNVLQDLYVYGLTLGEWQNDTKSLSASSPGL
jgi:hypothetical protein